MAGINDFQYGFDSSGISSYLEQIKSVCLQEAEEEIRNLETITNACNEHWEGQARDNFVENLNKDAEHVCTQLESLYNALETEVYAVSAAMKNKDETLIEVK